MQIECRINEKLNVRKVQREQLNSIFSCAMIIAKIYFSKQMFWLLTPKMNMVDSAVSWVVQF